MIFCLLGDFRSVFSSHSTTMLLELEAKIPQNLIEDGLND